MLHVHYCRLPDDVSSKQDPDDLSIGTQSGSSAKISLSTSRQQPFKN